MTHGTSLQLMRDSLQRDKNAGLAREAVLLEGKCQLKAALSSALQGKAEVESALQAALLDQQRLQQEVASFLRCTQSALLPCAVCCTSAETEASCNQR